jgi:hypothetical protein
VVYVSTFHLSISVFIPVIRILTRTFRTPHVQVALRAVPSRPDFYARISQGGSIEKLDTELAKWLVGLDSLVKHISAFLEQGGYGKV